MRESADGALVQEYSTRFVGGVWPDWLDLRQDGNFAGSTVATSSRPGRGVDLISAAGANKSAGVVVNQTNNLTSADISRLDLMFTMSGGGNADLQMLAGFVASDLSRGVALVRPFGPVSGTNSQVRAYASTSSVVDRVTTQRWEHLNPTQRFTLGISVIKRVVNGVPVRVVETFHGDQKQRSVTFTEAETPVGTIRAEIAAIGGPSAAGGAIHTLHEITYREHYAA